jgi:nitrate/TMAO reductase-like tetraheme cytochrome c subunit
MSQGCVTCHKGVSHVKGGHMSQGCVTCHKGVSHVKGGHMSKVVTCQRWSHVKGGHMSKVVTCHKGVSHVTCRGDVVAMSCDGTHWFAIGYSVHE